MYWVTGEYTKTKRPIAVPGPYRCIIDGDDYVLVLTYLMEVTEYDPDKRSVVDRIGANGYTVPERPLALFTKLDVWHVENPGVRVTLSVSGANVAAWVDSCRLSGEGSILRLGPSLHYQEENQTDDA